MNYNLRTDIAEAKNLGSAKSGSHHWLLQRITGIILVLCSIWFIYFIKLNSDSNLNIIISDLIKKPYNLLPFIILIITSFYHAMLGMRVVIEDYIGSIKLRTVLIILLQLFCIVTIAGFIVALFYSNS